MLYEKATKLPPFSTPTGIMFLLVFKMRQSIEFQKSRAIVQALISQQGAQDENIKKAFDDLKEAFFPFDRNQRQAELKKMREAMKYWINQGPVVVEAQMDPRQGRRMASKLARGQRSLEERKEQEKTGRIVGLDAFEKAKRRKRDS
jgi:hypothetical protein